MSRRFFVGGNFKMNGSCESLKVIVENLNNADLDPQTEVVVAPPTLYICNVRDHIKSGGKANLAVAAQNCYSVSSGAYTGEISAQQLSDVEVPWVIVGHSERRTLFGDTDDLIAKKVEACLAAKIKVIFCVGETLEQREAGKTLEVVQTQLAAVGDKVKDWSDIVVAYEPVWAIGTGKVATADQAQEVHKAIREWLGKNLSSQTAAATRIIYGGSVTAKNCKEIGQQPDVDGFLVGGASLKPEFVDIVNANRS
ncbi:triosephosphate isomerase [Tulasnella sp. 417]|nr:triosephosphate isomerase [Tulasnella sp. 417]